MKDCITNVLIIGMSGVLLWHFLNIWRYGQHFIHEPNSVILSAETAMISLIFAFGITKYITDLRKRG